MRKRTETKGINGKRQKKKEEKPEKSTKIHVEVCKSDENVIHIVRYPHTK